MIAIQTLSAQIIIIGDELLNGSISDANQQPLATWLFSRGIKLEKVTTVRDEPTSLTEAIKTAWANSDLIITTGGLGPTKDDITKAILGEIVSGALRVSPQAIELVSAQYRKLQKEWVKESNNYHLVPDGVEVFNNPVGLAPGLRIEKEGKLLLATPGVPRELKAMIEQEFDQLLVAAFSQFKQPDERISIRTRGIPEEKIFFEIMPNLWKELEAYGKVSSLPQLLGVDIHLQIPNNQQCESKEVIEAKLKNKLKDSPLAPYIWHWGPETLEEIVISQALQKKLTIGLSESCTGGLLAHRLTNISGSSQVFVGSLVTYANEAKVNILNVEKKTLEEFGAVSTQVASQMAKGARLALNVDISVALTGIAGPTGASENKPVGTLCIGDSTRLGSHAKRVNYIGDREQLKKRFSQAALFRLLEIIDTF